MSKDNYRQIEFSRFETSQKLAILLLEHKDIHNYTPEELANKFIEYTKIIDTIISSADFTEE